MLSSTFCLHICLPLLSSAIAINQTEDTFLPVNVKKTFELDILPKTIGLFLPQISTLQATYSAVTFTTVKKKKKLCYGTVSSINRYTRLFKQINSHYYYTFGQTTKSVTYG